MEKFIAQEILRQLGGHRFISMTGCREIMCLDSSIKMRLQPNKSKANYLLIKLMPNDTYTMQFFRFISSSFTIKIIEEITGVYSENLQDVFTDKTGFLTRMEVVN